MQERGDGTTILPWTLGEAYQGMVVICDDWLHPLESIESQGPQRAHKQLYANTCSVLHTSYSYRLI